VAAQPRWLCSCWPRLADAQFVVPERRPRTDPSRLVIAELLMRTDQHGATQKRQRALIERVVSQLGSVPGVRAVAPASPCLLARRMGRPVAVKPSHVEAAANPMIDMRVVTPPSSLRLWRGSIAAGRAHCDDRDEGGARGRGQRVGRASLRTAPVTGCGRGLLLDGAGSRSVSAGIVRDMRTGSPRGAKRRIISRRANPSSHLCPRCWRS
jgi:hypothetical protein